MKEIIPRILIVDDTKINRFLLGQMVEQMGFIAETAPSATKGIEHIHNEMPQLILLDIMMPEIDGFQMCEMLKENPVTRDIPIIFVSAMGQPEEKRRAFSIGASDYISKPFEYEEIKMRVNIHLKVYSMHRQLEEKNRRLSLLVSEQEQKIQTEQRRLLKAITTFAEGDLYLGMGNHLENVSCNARLLAEALNFTERYEYQLSNTFVEAIEMAAALHDIGKITVPRDILEKPSKLTQKELKIVREHTVLGYNILYMIYPDLEEHTFLKVAGQVIKYHHERWDGTGYPDGLKGEEIPLSARIVSIVDSYDCLLHDRRYRAAYSREEALKIMESRCGTKFDRYLLDIFFQIEKQLKNR